LKRILKFYLLLTLTVLALTSCSKKTETMKKNYTETIIDGVRYINNSTTPFYKKFDLNLKKLYTINGISDDLDSIETFTKIIKPIFDSERNIYIADAKTSSIKKFDKTGSFIRSIGKLGSGPGEFKDITEPLINNDTLLVYTYSKEVHRLNLDGGFINRTPFVKQNLIAIVQLSKKNDSSFIGYAFTFEKKEDEVKFVLRTSIYSYNVKEIKNIYKNDVSSEEYKKDPYKNLVRKEHVITHSKNNVFVTDRDNENYKIIGYSTKGKKEIEIRKNFRKIKYTEDELNYLIKLIENPEDLKKMYDYKPAIYRLLTDKSENLWVNTYGPDQQYKQEYDVFNKNGIFIGEYKVDFEDKKFQQFSESESIGFFFEEDLLVILDYDNITVNVYEYEINMSDN